MHRFFIPPEWIRFDRVTLQGELVHQLSHVLRLRPGDRIVVLDNAGWDYEVELQVFSREKIEGTAKERRHATGEPRTQVVLYQSLLKGDKLEFVMQKGTELGVAAFVPMLCERCVVASMAEMDGKTARWQRILREAAEQSERGKVPDLKPVHFFHQAVEDAPGLKLIAWEEEKEQALWAALRRSLRARTGDDFTVSLFIGPEGGFTAQEVELAQSHGVLPVTLGPRVLRAETAGMVAATIVLYEAGDLGG
ncbi:MAG: RsmE family RNA methyltransferase [Chloroflexota bacterium]|nr:RsmE family RNA methyltransferase [Chloroflexota bacterium]